MGQYALRDTLVDCAKNPEETLSAIFGNPGQRMPCDTPLTAPRAYLDAACGES